MEWKRIWDYSENDNYILNKGNGYIKEYDIFGQLLFKGNYENGEKNGEGIEYYNYDTLYEGEYSNGIRIGEGWGREYDSVTDNLIYEGEYFNGKRNGEGIIYFNDNIIFEGEFKNGKKLKGIKYKEDGTAVEVEYKN